MRHGSFRLADLVRNHRNWQQLTEDVGATAGGHDGAPALAEVTGFGSNPGALRMLAHVPEGLAADAPLVVALHGCTQGAAGYATGSGWIAMAEARRFALLLPEQRTQNNANRCFSWFEPEDTTRDRGEVLSIRQGVAQMLALHRLDERRVFVAGLSAGGAMATALLAAYPEVFAGGAVIGGLPYGAADSVQAAMSHMARPERLAPAARAAAVRAASGHQGPWPRVAIWHGTADSTVHPHNAEETLAQWLELHGLTGRPPAREGHNGAHLHRAWTGPDGHAVVEIHALTGMGHGVPLAAGAGEGRCGRAGPFLLDVGVSSTHGALAFWGLAEPVEPEARAETPGATEGLQATIERALAAAGLLRGR